MRYTINAQMEERIQRHSSLPEENNVGEFIEVHTDDLKQAQILFRHLMTTNVRPLFLIDNKENTQMWWADRGICGGGC